MNYAILILGLSIDLKRFAHEDEWRLAMLALNRSNVGFAAFKYHHGAGVWQQVEVVQ